MFSKATKTGLLSAAVLSAAFFAQSASAEMITNWDYTVTSGFSNYTFSSGTGQAKATANNANGDPTKLTWGVPANSDNAKSSVGITGEVNGSVMTDGPAVAGATFNHNNRIITDKSKTLKSFMLSTQLDLTATLPASEAGTTKQIGPITFDSFFTETPNVAGQCTAGSGSVCDDIFVLSNADGVAALNQGQTFTVDGYQYVVTLAIDGLRTLNDDECAAAGAGSGCVGFTTQEGQNNQFTSSFTITSSALPVPEPGNLAMLAIGLGLIGFGVYARRRNLQS